MPFFSKLKNNRVNLSPRVIMRILSVILFVLFICCAVFACSPVAENGLTAQISEYKSGTRHIEREEFEFFRSVVKKDTYAELDDSELDALTREYICDVNTKFCLGSCLGLCGPYDFSTMKYDMQQENISRKAKKESGEPIYGPERFTEETYFRYIYSKLETDIFNYLVDNADKETVESARKYYEANKSVFEAPVSVTYELTENNASSTVTADSAELRNISNSDTALYDFLINSGEGESFDYEYFGSKRNVKLIEKISSAPEFDEAYNSAMTYYITNEVIEGLYETVAENNPVIFDFG